jgi:hypothetical protein
VGCASASGITSRVHQLPPEIDSCAAPTYANSRSGGRGQEFVCEPQAQAADEAVRAWAAGLVWVPAEAWGHDDLVADAESMGGSEASAVESQGRTSIVVGEDQRGAQPCFTEGAVVGDGY